MLEIQDRPNILLSLEILNVVSDVALEEFISKEFGRPNRFFNITSLTTSVSTPITLKRIHREILSQELKKISYGKTSKLTPKLFNSKDTIFIFLIRETISEVNIFIGKTLDDIRALQKGA